MPPKGRRSTRQQATLSFAGKNSKVTKVASPRSVKSIKDDALPVNEAQIIEDPELGTIKKVTNASPPQSARSKKDDASLPNRAQIKEDPELEERPTITNIAIREQAEEEARSLSTVTDPLESQGESNTAEDVLGGRAPESNTGAVGGSFGSGWVADEETQARKITQTQINRYWRAKEQERKAPRVHQQDLSVHEKILREWDMSGQYGPCIGIARLKRWKRANMLGLSPPMEVLAVMLRKMDDGDGAQSQRAYVDGLMNSRFVET